MQWIGTLLLFWKGFGYHFPPHLSPPEFRQESNNSLVPVYALHEEKYPGRGKRTVLTAIKMAQAQVRTQTFQSEVHRGKTVKFRVYRSKLIYQCIKPIKMCQELTSYQ